MEHLHSHEAPASIQLDTAHPWYAVQTQPRRETVAEAHIERLGVPVFCPRYRQRVILHGYRRDVVRPLFPGYLFAAPEPEVFRAVHYAHGARAVVTFGSEPAEVPRQLLDAVVARMRDGYVLLEPPALEHGQKVEIIAGPFSGYTAIFQEQWTGADRVAILLDSLTYNARVVLDRAAVRAMQ